MDRTLYASLANRASDLVEAGEHQQAIDVLAQLVESELPDFDKAVMWLNIATVQDKMGNPEGALASYASALEWEGRTSSYFVAQQHAAYLAHLGKYDDGISVYQSLIERTDVKPEDREVFVANITTLQKLAGR
jgi:tetratricopeptide (TPR) repeat protein